MKKSFQKNPKNRGFTIVETLVAITILMIAIVGPLTISHKGLLAAIYARDQVTASYLAQDAMEYIKNIKDTNLLNGSSWLAGLENCYDSTQSKCKVNTLNGSITNCVDSGESCLLYKNNDNSGYSHDFTQTRTQFSRYFYITNITTDEAKIVVMVKWINGVVSNQVLYENEIFNVTK